ncbi:MAG TPA: hypothetical protein VNA31_03305, partial [bacterium]|nr:hypothetical protein [bacterium]
GTLTAADVAAAEKSGVLQSAAEKLEAAPTEDTDKDQDPWWSTTPQAILAFVAQLRQITIEFGAFEAGTAAQALYDGLNKIELSFSDGSTRKAGEFLKEAASVLLGADVNPPEFVTMPRRWPVIETKVAETLAKAVRAALSERATRVAPHEGRFAQASREYVLRAFVRVRSDDGCPPKTFWSELSKSFTIAPWYAASEAPPVPIALPDPTDRRFLAQLKPNVAFVLPKPLFNLLKSDPKKLMVGDASIDQGTGGGGAGGDQGPDVSWICGFNIPIITICAFIVLNIFLSLFNLIFWWLPFVKICIPLPKRSPVS